MPNICLDLPPKPYAQQDSGGDGGAVGSSNSLSSSSSSKGSSSNGSGGYNEDGVTSTATNSLSHGTHRELPTVSTKSQILSNLRYH